MQQAGTLAARNAVGATKAQSHRIVAVAAIDDIASNRLPEQRWGHPRLALLLRTDPEFLRLLQRYLLWRTAGIPRNIQHVRTVGDGCARARVYVAKGRSDAMVWEPSDLFSLHGRTEQERMADLFAKATQRRLSVHTDISIRAEKFIALACGGSFEDLCDAVKETRISADTLARALV